MKNMLDRHTYPLWAAIENFTRVRDVNHHLVETLPDDPGRVHALSRDGMLGGDPEYFEGHGPYAVCGHPVDVRLPMHFVKEDPDACHGCVKLLNEGRRTPRRATSGYECRCTVEPGGDYQGHLSCAEQSRHTGPHRALTGETWDTGPEDFTPAPDGYV